MSAAATNRCLCPSCNGVGYPMGNLCGTCRGFGYLSLPDVSSSTGLRGGAYPSTQDEITLEGKGSDSEVDLQLTPNELRRIRAAADQMERDNLERLRAEYRRELVLWWIMGAIVLAAVVSACVLVVFVLMVQR